ncbi:MAG: DUF222 domain-containing protein [Microthrixaceae bacterium]
MAAVDDTQPVAAAARALTALDADALSDAELTDVVLELQHLRAQLDAVEAEVLARWEAERCWQVEGAKTGAAWLAWKQRIPITVARKRIRHARAMRTLPEVASAWAAGEIDRAHVSTLLGVRTTRTTQAFDHDHTQLLHAARTTSFVEFKRRCDRWELMVDPDGAEQGAADERAAREVYLSQSFGGMWFGRSTLDPLSGAIVDETLAAIVKELFTADWAKAKARLGRDPLATELGRSPAQRRADALVEMATRARTAPADGRRPAPLFTVVVDYDTLAGPVLELFNRTVLTPGTVAPWLNDAYVERVVFDSPSRVIDVGAQRRFFRGALRRAIEVRDRTCFHPSCDEVPLWPEVDHIVEHARGGPTTQWNGRLGCHHHNLDRVNHPERYEPPGDPPSPSIGDPHAGPDPPAL